MVIEGKGKVPSDESTWVLPSGFAIAISCYSEAITGTTL